MKRWEKSKLQTVEAGIINFQKKTRTLLVTELAAIEDKCWRRNLAIFCLYSENLRQVDLKVIA